MKILKLITKITFLAVTSLVAASLTACTLDPKYQTPKTKISLEDSSNLNNVELTEIHWKNFFQSTELQNLIELALNNNLDLKIANLNIESAKANYNIVSSNLLPSINGIASQSTQGVPSAFASFTPKTQYRANLSLAAYEIDFFGRFRSLKKSALEDFLSTKEAREITKISLIAETANIYAQFLADKKILDITKDAMDIQESRLEIIKARYNKGIVSKSELLNAEIDLENIKMSFESSQKIVTQDKNTLMLLTGVFDEKLLPLESSLEEIIIVEESLNFLPSKSLLSRPDIKKAEHILKSANANIGAARAAFFPSITLTGNYGYGSRDLTDLLSSKTWSITPQINLPIFSGGRGLSNLKISNIRKKIEIINYEKSIQTAFKEVLDSLSERQSTKNRLKSSDDILTARQNNYKISQKKYNAKITGALEVLDNKLILLSAKQNQIINKREYIANLISLYKVLGGGSKIEEKEI